MNIDTGWLEKLCLDRKNIVVVGEAPEIDNDTIMKCLAKMQSLKNVNAVFDHNWSYHALAFSMHF